MLEQFQNILQIFHYPLSFLPLLTVSQPFKDIFGNCMFLMGQRNPRWNVSICQILVFSNSFEILLRIFSLGNVHFSQVSVTLSDLTTTTATAGSQLMAAYGWFFVLTAQDETLILSMQMDSNQFVLPYLSPEASPTMKAKFRK